MATQKITIGERGSFGYIAIAAHHDAMNRLRELTERLEKEHGAVTDDEQRSPSDEAT